MDRAPEVLEKEEHSSAVMEIERVAAQASPRLDESGQKIFIPGRGWMPIAEFMEIYENQPELLPDDLDLLAIHKIRESLAGRG